jgi:hypothetical protein
MSMGYWKTVNADYGKFKFNLHTIAISTCPISSCFTISSVGLHWPRTERIICTYIMVIPKKIVICMVCCFPSQCCDELLLRIQNFKCSPVIICGGMFSHAPSATTTCRPLFCVRSGYSLHSSLSSSNVGCHILIYLLTDLI